MRTVEQVDMQEVLILQDQLKKKDRFTALIGVVFMVLGTITGMAIAVNSAMTEVPSCLL